MRYILTLLILTVAIHLSAQTILPEKAKQNAVLFLQSQTSTSKSPRLKTSGSNLHLAHTAKTGGKVHFYVFNNDQGGFIIAGGDEVAEEILAYSDEGSFDIDNIPDNFRWWLNQYEEQIEFAINNPTTGTVIPKNETKKTNIEPLVQTKWDQLSPYNKLCPKIGTRATYTGCVATAMSQVMKTHEWPKVGTGSHSYYDDESKLNLETNFYEHYYDWDNMPFIYDSRSTGQQDTAVAQLMYDCGVAVEMMYSTTGSGAFTEYVPYAFTTYFGYDKGVHHLYRDYYSDEQWADIIYNELAEGHPVMYGGCTVNDEGHSFICDGYRATDNAFHFNWGWSGSYNNYCKLSAIKSGSDVWKYYQDVVVGIQKPVAGSKPFINLIIYDDCSLNYTTKESDGYTTYNINFGTYTYDHFSYKGFMYSDSWSAAELVLTMKYTNTETGETFYAAQKDINSNKIQTSSIYGHIEDFTDWETLTIKDVIVPNLKPGTYRVSIAYRKAEDINKDDDSLWQEVLAFTSCSNYQLLTIENKIEAPVATQATNITDNGFTANWTSVADATSYSLELTSIDSTKCVPTTIIEEKFNRFASMTDGNSDIGASLDEYMNTSGWTGEKVYESNARAKLASTKAGSRLTSPLLTATGGDVTVTLTEGRYSSTTSTVTVSLIDADGNTIGDSQSIATADKTHELVFSNVNKDFCVQLTSATGKRYYLYYIKVAAAQASATTTMIDNITDTTYVFTELDPTLTYSYRVKALINEDESKWSNSQTVQLSSTLLLGDANSDGVVDVADITTIAAFILGNNPSPWNMNNADVDGDGAITVADITATAGIILK